MIEFKVKRKEIALTLNSHRHLPEFEKKKAVVLFILEKVGLEVTKEREKFINEKLEKVFYGHYKDRRTKFQRQHSSFEIFINDDWFLTEIEFSFEEKSCSCETTGSFHACVCVCVCSCVVAVARVLFYVNQIYSNII